MDAFSHIKNIFSLCECPCIPLCVSAELVLRVVGRGRVRACGPARAAGGAYQRHEPAAHQQGREHASVISLIGLTVREC